MNKVFFIGIGGIGISAAAGILHAKSFIVYGSDAQENDIIKELRHSGLKIFVPHNADNITSDIDLVVHSVAVPEDNFERVRARELNILEVTYPQLLGEILKNKYGIGISGTDGKTTTTAMVAKIMIDAGKDPAVVLGSQAEFLEGNWRSSDNSYFIFEADEYRRAFDNYSPKVAIITNIGIDHLDYYKDADEYLETFKKYLNKLPSDGLAIINNDDSRSIEASKDCQAKKATYAIDVQADYVASDIKILSGRQEFFVQEKGEVAATINIALPGNYNISNALAAVVFARQEGIDWLTIVESLKSFKGTWRRFDNLGRLNQAEVIADYAHTPPAIKLVIKATNDFYPNKKILFVFQPHQYARTKNLFNEFSEAFEGAEKVLIADIFYVEGREKPEDYDVSSEKLAAVIKSQGIDAVYSGDLIETEKQIREVVDQFDVIMVLGAGNIYEVAKNLVK